MSQAETKNQALADAAAAVVAAAVDWAGAELTATWGYNREIWSNIKRTKAALLAAVQRWQELQGGEHA